MRLSSNHIKNLIDEARVKGADRDYIRQLESLLEERRALKSKRIDNTRTSSDGYVCEEIDKEGKKVVYYSTVPLSEEDKSYFK